jgi:dihydroflavonol-4-reductase
MRALVTGASGFIGSHLCRALCQSGMQVRAFLRTSSSRVLIADLELEIVAGDLFDPSSIRAALQDVDVVFHCAGAVGHWRDEARMIASHVEGTRSVLQAASEAGVRRLIYTSSVAALGLPPVLGQNENTHPLLDESHIWNSRKSVWPYGYAKHHAEQEVLNYIQQGLSAVIVNPASVFGAGDINRVSGGIIWQMAQGRVPPVYVRGGINTVHIDDVVAGHLAAWKQGRDGERYILGGHNLTLQNLLAIVAELTQGRPPRWSVPPGLLHRTAWILDWMARLIEPPIRGHIFRLAGRYFFYNTTKATRELGLAAPIPFRRAAAESYAWYREQEML